MRLPRIVKMPDTGQFLSSTAVPAAAGTNQATATQLVAQSNLVTAADGTKGVALPSAFKGMDVTILNTVTTASLKVYPFAGDSAAINAIAADGAFVIGPGRAARFTASSKTQWYVADVATGGQTFTNTGLKIQDTAGDNTTTIKQNSDEASDRTANIPALGGNDTFAMLGQANAFTAAQTTTDGVAAGTARKIGGMAFVDTAAADTVTAAASANAFVAFAQKYTVPANTIKAGTVIRVKAMVDVSDAAAGTATLTINCRLGGTSLIATTAVDPAANDFQVIDFVLVGRAAPGATAAVVGHGKWLTSVGGTNVSKDAILQSTNFATNGALDIDVQAKWSAADATTTARLQLLNVEVIG